MIQFSAQLFMQYMEFIGSRGVQPATRQYYAKWLRYYLDFCHKYDLHKEAEESLAAFVAKLREKKQTENQRRQASHAISLYYEMGLHFKRKVSNDQSRSNGAVRNRISQQSSTSSTIKNTFYQATQADDAVSLHDGKTAFGTKEIFKQSRADWTGV